MSGHSWLRPTVWLTGRLSFSRKYLLIGLVVLSALCAVSVPLLARYQLDRERAMLELEGIERWREQVELLQRLVLLRRDAQRDPVEMSPADLDPAVRMVVQLNRRSGVMAQADLLERSWLELVETWPASEGRFAALNNTSMALQRLIQASARRFRLSVDPDLDLTFDMLIVQLPTLLDTLGKQHDAIATRQAELVAYALSAQVMLSSVLPSLHAGVDQQLALASDHDLLRQVLTEVAIGVPRQQDLADQAAQGSSAMQALTNESAANLKRVARLLHASGEGVTGVLRHRVAELELGLAVVFAILLSVLAGMSYLFAGIYLSTLRSLRSLSEGTTAFCSGDLDTRIQIDTADEMVQIAGNFNRMAAEVRRLLDLIRRQNESRERELETQVAARTAELAQKNAQLRAAGLRVSQEIDLARNMQMAILPQQFPDHPGWSVHACMHPAREMGGDFYDEFQLGDGRHGLLVADVSGKGVGAAFFMAVARTVLLDVATEGQPPAQVLARANALLCERNPMDMFVTVLYGIFDPVSGRFDYASAGHHAPLLRRRDGDVTVFPIAHDLALGVMPGASYEGCNADVAEGETLLLYTDGVTEAFSASGVAFGDDRLARWLSRAETQRSHARDLVLALVDEVDRFVGDADASDDLTCLAICRA